MGNILPIKSTASYQSSQQHPTNQVNSILPIKLTAPYQQVNNILPIKSTASYQSSQQHPTNQVNNILPIKSTASYQSSQQHLTNQVNNILPIKPTPKVPIKLTQITLERSTLAKSTPDVGYAPIGATLLDTLFENHCGVKGKSRIKFVNWS